MRRWHWAWALVVVVGLESLALAQQGGYGWGPGVGGGFGGPAAAPEPLPPGYLQNRLGCHSRDTMSESASRINRCRPHLFPARPAPVIRAGAGIAAGPIA